MPRIALPQILDRRDLEYAGMDSRRVTGALRLGELTRIRPGLFVRGAEWVATRPEGQMLLRAHAVERASSHMLTYSHLSAAAAHGLPVILTDSTKVHTTAIGERTSAMAGVIRHRGPLPDDEVTDIDGIRYTSIERTLADVARTATFETAVAVIDAGLRGVAARGTKYDVAAADAVRERAVAIASRARYGAERARRALEFADGRAQRPGESLSRVRLMQLGFRPPILQFVVPAPHNGRYFVDMLLEEADVFAEFDGKGNSSILRCSGAERRLRRSRKRRLARIGSAERPVGASCAGSGSMSSRSRRFGIA